MTGKMKSALLIAALVVGVGQTAIAEYPERPITWIVPFAAGGVTDITSRRLAEKLSEELGQSVVVENKPGAGGLVGTKEGQIAPPDGYTVTFATSGPIAIQAALDSGRLQYDPLKDFEYIHGVSLSPQLLVANKDAPFNSLEELISYAKENPGELTFASPGIGTAQHLGGELFKKAAGLDILHVPYTAGTSQMVDLAAGVIDISFEYYPIVKPYVDDGKMKILGTTSAERLKVLPDTQAMSEAGYPDAQNYGWTLLAVPAGTPPDVRSKLEEAMANVMANPEIVESSDTEGRLIPDLKGDDEIKSFVKDQIEIFRAAAEGVSLK